MSTALKHETALGNASPEGTEISLETFAPPLSIEEKKAVRYILAILGESVTKDDLCRRVLQEFINLIKNNPDLLHDAITGNLKGWTEKEATTNTTEEEKEST